MPDFTQDKAAERDRYDQRARTQLAGHSASLGLDGAASQPRPIRRPYLVYEEFIRQSARPGGWEALDVCCGTGLYSLVAASAGAGVTASDIAENNLALARQRAERTGVALRTAVADAERLPFPDASFDLITCSGSLSYVDLDRFLTEVRRLLRPGGWFVCVDSLNHNPVYRLNRYVQYRRGRRTLGTLERMPTLATIAAIERRFEAVETSYHGIASFLAPVLRAVVGEQMAAASLDGFDRRAPFLRRYAFKFVLRARRPAA